MKKLNVKKSLLGLTMAAVMLAGTAPWSAMATLAEQQEAIKPTFGNYYSSDYDTREETMEASFELNERIAGEGIVMLKNEDNALPINEGSKISVFGKNSAYFLSGGGGSGAGGGAPVTSLYDALQQEGFEINTKLMNFYRDASLSGAGRGATPDIGATVPGYNTGETPISS